MQKEKISVYSKIVSNNCNCAIEKLGTKGFVFFSFIKVFWRLLYNQFNWSSACKKFKK
jgi:hypothetical protein